MDFERDKIKNIESFLKIASDATRIKIMLALLDHASCEHVTASCNCGSCKYLSCMIEKSVNDIAHEVGESQSLISHQLKKLKDANYVSTRKDKNKVYYRLKDGHIKVLLEIVLEHLEEERKK